MTTVLYNTENGEGAIHVGPEGVAVVHEMGPSWLQPHYSTVYKLRATTPAARDALVEEIGGMGGDILITDLPRVVDGSRPLGSKRAFDAGWERYKAAEAERLKKETENPNGGSDVPPSTVVL